MAAIRLSNRVSVLKLHPAVGDHPALTWLEDEGITIGGLGREDYFGYETRFGALPGIRAAVRLEPGIQSGAFPAEVLPITSLVGQFLKEQELAGMADDLTGFDMTLLHYRRTFVEKMFALHGKVIRLRDEDYPLGRDARHYPDLHALAGQDEVLAMLESPEYKEIRDDYDAMSRQYFPRGYRPPKGLSFTESPAFFPSPELRKKLSEDYEIQCELLFSGGSYPSLDEVFARFEEIRHLL